MPARVAVGGLTRARTSGAWGLCHLGPCSPVLGSARRRTTPSLGRGGGGRIHPSLLVCPHPARCRVQAPLSSASLRRRCAPRPGGVGLRSSCPPLSAPHCRSRMLGMSPDAAVPHPPTHSCTGCALSMLVCHADPQAWQPRPLLRASPHHASLRRGEKRRSATARRSRRKVRLLSDTVLWASPRPRWEHRARVEVAGARPRRALRSSLARALHFLGLLRRCRLHLHALCSSAFALLSSHLCLLLLGPSLCAVLLHTAQVVLDRSWACEYRPAFYPRRGARPQRDQRAAPVGEARRENGLPARRLPQQTDRQP